MGQYFDDYPGFQQIPGMPILLQQSVGRDKKMSSVVGSVIQPPLETPIRVKHELT